MKKTILVIEPDKKELRNLREILSKEGYSIMTATDIETAVNICRSIEVDYILSETANINLKIQNNTSK
ncbi:MAG: response regulator [Melioribacteraceae bacterium]|nr:response regulator [Melioribacteraceae bacterium]MCF8354982.1 response regulator [Melioribacteraceae bacterium]MCF8394001.1 response regulator [Melioribacteraceae bacterium]MCF8419796.1 response regulator [Melioribacteraceae bacterium]